MNETLTQARLKELLNYSPVTGLFTWKGFRGGSAIAGAVAGNVRAKDGYVQIKIDGTLYLANRLAMLYVEGVWPKLDVDHRNGKRWDNRIENLRHATRAQNGQNQGVRSDNTSGAKGVYWFKKNKKWRATIQAFGKKIHIGLFDTVADASLAYEVKAKEFFGEFKRAS